MEKDQRPPGPTGSSMDWVGGFCPAAVDPVRFGNGS
jgi:hypothetical protein